MTNTPNEEDRNGKTYVETIAAWGCSIVLVVWITASMASISRSLELIAMNLQIVMQMSVKTADLVTKNAQR